MEIDLKRYIVAIKSRMWIIILIVAAASMSSAQYTKEFNPNYYTATSKLIVNKTVDVLGSKEMDLSSINVNIQLIETYKEIILTPAIMDKVVEHFPDLGLTSNQLMDIVSVNSLNETQVMSIQATDVDYARAAKTVNAVSTVFQTEIPKIMKVDNVAILTEAKENEPSRPYGQNLKLNVIVSSFVALLLSIGLILLLEYFNTSIKSEDEITSLLGIQSFGTVPKMKKKDLKWKIERYSTETNLQAGEQSL